MLFLFLININVGRTIMNRPFGNGLLYLLFMVIWGLVYGIVSPTLLPAEICATCPAQLRLRGIGFGEGVVVSVDG